MKTRTLRKVLVALSLIPLFSFSQTIKDISYSIVNKTATGIPVMGTPQIQATAYQLFQLDIQALKEGLQGLTYREGEVNGFVGRIELPHTDGTTRTYTVKRNQTLHPELNALFPEILTMDAYATDGSGAFCKWDITPQGLHAMIMIPGQSTIFIDPYIAGNTEYYIVYRKKDFVTNKFMECAFVEAEEELGGKEAQNDIKAMFGSCELRTYRLALSATVEYTTFHGGTVALAQAAQATSMNRVNGVYEKDIAITMVIIPNNNQIIYATAPDPFTNGTPGTMINQNQTNTDNVIGSANYDIGHVFGTNSGGLAGLGVVCSGGNKARGVTGSSAPIGDPFDIDYVAHEMGHQFGGNHTQNNNCNSVAAARREPGSASTIMGYAGICAPNVQNNSDDYFHGYNLGEISTEILSTGHQCEVITALNNAAPTITSTGGNINVPANTPFVLTATATDPNPGDVLTYLWEQMDNEASTQPPVATATGGPNFRSFDPSTNPSRYFPNLQALAANGPFTWEVLPSITRTMDFRLTVKDNHAVGACNDYADITVTTSAAAGPFVVTYPSATGISWAANSTQTVTWDVANTTAAPINCATVRILLSIDGGVTYPTELNSGTANDGTETVLVPNTPTTTARIMIISSAGTFFDISNNNFAITACTPADIPTLSAVQPICYGDPATISVAAGNLNDATQWEWFSGSCNGTSVGTGTSINVTPTVSTTYYAIGNGGCAGATCASQTITVPSLINDQVTQNGNQLTAQETNASYQWIDCANNAPIAGATGQSFVPAAVTGNYAVVLTSGGCSDTSACFLVDQSGLEEMGTFNVQIQPNPFEEQVLVSWEGLLVEKIELTDAFGKLVATYTVAGVDQLTLQAQNLSKGVYFVRLLGHSGTEVKQLIKQ